MCRAKKISLTNDTTETFLKLKQEFTRLVATDQSAKFKQYHNKIISNSMFDEILGGMFSPTDHRCKALKSNAELAAIYTIAANTFADPDYANLSNTSLNYLITHHRLETGWFAQHSISAKTAIEPEILKSHIDNAQWIALKIYFGLSDNKPFFWQGLHRQISINELSNKSGLHPKQAPWALDGAIQILRHLIGAATPSADYVLLDNLILCHSLLLSATYLNQTHHADVAIELFDNLSSQNHLPHQAFWILLLLQRLAFHWDETCFTKLAQIVTTLPEKQTSLAQVLVEYVSKDARPKWHDINQQEHTDESPFLQLLSHCQFLLVIEGPAYLARQWLQLSNNQYNPKLWIFARPTEQDTRARLLNSNGEEQIFERLEDLTSRIANLE